MTKIASNSENTEDEVPCICKMFEVDHFFEALDKVLAATAICLQCNQAWHTQP